MFNVLHGKSQWNEAGRINRAGHTVGLCLEHTVIIMTLQKAVGSRFLTERRFRIFTI